MELYLDKFKTIRKHKKLTLKEVADLMGINRCTVNGWANGKRVPSEAKIRMLARVLNITADQISDLEPDLPTSETSISSAISTLDSSANSSKSKNNFESIFANLSDIMEELNNAKLVINGINKATKALIYIKDYQQNFVSANHTFLKHLSLPTDYRVLGKTDSDFFTEKESNENYKLDEEVLRTGTPLNYEGVIPSCRNKKWALISKTPIFDDEHKVLGLISTYTDITERKKNEQRRETLEQNIDLLNVGVWITHKGKYIYQNKVIEEIYGYRRDEINNVEEWVEKALHPDSVQEFRNGQAITKKESNEIIHRLKIVTKDGAEKWIRSKEVTKMINGEEFSFSIDEDITEMVKSKEAISAFTESITAAGDSLWIFNDYKMEIAKITVLLASKTTKKMFGISPEQLIENPFIWLKYVDKEDREKVENWIDSDASPKEIDYRYTYPGTSTKWIRSRVYKNIQNYYMTSFEVTEQYAMTNKIATISEYLSKKAVLTKEEKNIAKLIGLDL